MSDPFIGEIRMFPYTFAPENWAECKGQLLPIERYPALYAVLGTTYGGNGTSTFGVPDLRGRTPVHPGNGVTPGLAWGMENVHLYEHSMPAHTHTLNAVENEENTVATPTGNLAAQSSSAQMYGPAGSTMVELVTDSISSVGGGAAHTNVQPSMGMRFCIALEGLFPSRS